jgi:glutaredoxin
MHVKILGKPGCHLCHVAVKIARHLEAELRITVEYVDIAQDDALLETYGSRIPVLLIEDVESAWGRLTEGEMRRAIRRARWRRPISRILSRVRKFLAPG